MKHEDFVTYDQAVKLKELGFGWECIRFYNISQSSYPLFKRIGEYEIEFGNYNNKAQHLYSAPTLAQVQKWLRETHKLWVEPVIRIGNVNYYSCDIYDIKTADECYYMDGPTANIEDIFNTPEEALSAGIDRALKILKQKQ